MRLNPTNISIIQRLLIGRVNRPLRAILARLKPSDVASLINLLKDSDRKRLIQAMGLNAHLLDVLGQLPESQMRDLFEQMSPEWVSDLLHFAPESDGAYYLSQLSEEARSQTLTQLDAPKRSKLLQYLNYPEDSAGRLMTESVFALPSDLSAEACIEEIRKRSHTESIYYIYCIDEFQRLVGVVSLRSLVTADKDTPLDQLARKDVITVKPDTPSEDVANLVAKYDLVALPVVNDDHELIGIVPVDDVVDLVQEKATAMFYASAGLQEDDRIYTSWMRSLQRRLPWMILNLALAGLASVVVSLFEATISELVVLAFLQNIVAATGGNSAIQTLTVVTRGLATDDFQFISLKKAVLKEALVGLCIGLVLGALAAVSVFLWKGDIMVSAVLGLAMALNLPLASMVSSLIPVMVKRLNFDPAVSSGVLATMFTDIFGFFSFLGIATLAMKMLGTL